MRPQQMLDFDSRREAVLRNRLKTNPNFRAMRRDRRVAFAASIVRYAVAVGILLFLIKAFVISQSGVDGYMAMVSPLLAQLPQDGLAVQAVSPDAYSTMLAGTFAEWMSGNAPAVADTLESVERIEPASNGS